MISDGLGLQSWPSDNGRARAHLLSCSERRLPLLPNHERELQFMPNECKYDCRCSSELDTEWLRYDYRTGPEGDRIWPPNADRIINGYHCRKTSRRGDDREPYRTKPLTEMYTEQHTELNTERPYQMTFSEKRSTETLPNTGSPDNTKMHKKNLLSYTINRDEFPYYSWRSRSNVGDTAIDRVTLSKNSKPCQLVNTWRKPREIKARQTCSTRSLKMRSNTFRPWRRWSKSGDCDTWGRGQKFMAVMPKVEVGNLWPEVCRQIESQTELCVESLRFRLQSRITITLLPSHDGNWQSIWWKSRRGSNEFSKRGR